MLVIMYIKILNSKIISLIFFVCILLLILTSYRLIEYGFPENCKNCLKKPIKMKINEYAFLHTAYPSEMFYFFYFVELF